MLLSFDELLKFVLMRSVFCANIAKIDQSGFHVKKKNASSFLKGFLISELFWIFLFFFRFQPMPFSYEHCSISIFIFKRPRPPARS